jgi:ferritin-like metal-binding protein YciE
MNLDGCIITSVKSPMGRTFVCVTASALEAFGATTEANSGVRALAANLEEITELALSIAAQQSTRFVVISYPAGPRLGLGRSGNGNHLHTKEHTMTDPKEHLLDWLRDAHAMEQQAEQMLKAQAGRLEHYPDLKARVEQHLTETLAQQKLVDSCIQRLGGSNSTVKDIAGKLMAVGQGLAGMTATDEVVKGAISGYVFETLEIASYTALIAAAQAAGDAETKRVCEQLLEQEVQMSEWLLQHLPEVTATYLSRADAGVEAKR